MGMIDPSSEPLRQLADRRGVLIGSCVGVEYLRHDPAYRAILEREFNVITPENAMKFELLHPACGRWEFNDADEIVSFAADHDMEVRGHTLVWHRRIPGWIVDGGYRRDELMAILRDHIHTVVGRYRGRVRTWDVVNEALPMPGDASRERSLWRQVIGTEFIELAFHWAHEADPGARLFYNDDHADGLSEKSDAVYGLARRLMDRGVPLHGIGLQMHTGLGWSPSPREIAANIRRFADLGLEVHITEMDVQIQTGHGSPSERWDAQANVYGEILRACLDVPAFKALVMWGVTDRHSWIPDFTGHGDSPLIFDESYRPKPAYNAVARALGTKR